MSLNKDQFGRVYRKTMMIWRRKARQEVQVSRSTKKHHFKSLCPNLLSKLKTELATKRARHAEAMKETRQRLEDAQKEILERRNMEAESQIQVVQTQAIKSVENANMKNRGDIEIMGRQLLEEMMNQQKETMEQMKAWFVQTQQECLRHLAATRDEKLRKTSASVTP